MCYYLIALIQVRSMIKAGSVRFFDGARAEITLYLEMLNGDLGRIVRSECLDGSICQRVKGKLMHLGSKEIYLSPLPNASFEESATSRSP